MPLTVHLNTEGPEFHAGDLHWRPAPEAARILRALADELEAIDPSVLDCGYRAEPIRNASGIVGEWSLT